MPPGTERPRPGPPPGRGQAALDFFFYGTLCDADVRRTVIGRETAVSPAALEGYEAVPVEHGRFPILLFQQGRSAAGVVCAGLSVEEAARLGLYEHEGRDYTARQMPVRETGGATRKAWAFLPLAALRRGPGRWDLAEWQRFAKADFLARVERRVRAIEARELAPLIEIWRGRAPQREA